MSAAENPLPPEPGPDLRLVEKREHTLLSLIELSHELRVSSDLQSTTDLVLLNLMGHFGATRAAIWLAGDHGDSRAVLVRAYGLTAAAASAFGSALFTSSAERFARDPSVVRLDEWPEERHVPATRQALASGIELVAPVTAHGELLGMLVLGRRLGHQMYGAIDLQYVGAAAGLAGTALENNRLYRRVTETNRQLREANEHLVEVDVLRTQMVQNVNHELRTPLAVILGFLELMPDDPALPERHRRALKAALEQTQKLAGLIENLLDFSGSANGALQVECMPGDLRIVLREIAESRRPNVESGLRRLETDIPTALALARFDERRLMQVVHLVLDNAEKFTPQGACITMRADEVLAAGRTWVQIEIEDDGPGIPQDKLDHLFEPFRQGDGSMTRRAGGMGLGLALVSLLIQRMDGHVEAASAPGSGVCIRIRLPVA